MTIHIKPPFNEDTTKVNPRQWMRTHGNEHWESNDSGLMRIRDTSANDYPIDESERRYL